MEPRIEITLDELYRIIGELEVTRRKHQEIIAKLVQDAEPTGRDIKAVS